MSIHSEFARRDSTLTVEVLEPTGTYPGLMIRALTYGQTAMDARLYLTFDDVRALIPLLTEAVERFDRENETGEPSPPSVDASTYAFLGAMDISASRDDLWESFVKSHQMYKANETGYGACVIVARMDHLDMVRVYVNNADIVLMGARDGVCFETRYAGSNLMTRLKQWADAQDVCVPAFSFTPPWKVPADDPRWDWEYPEPNVKRYDDLKWMRGL